MKTCCAKHFAWSLLGKPPLAENESECFDIGVERSKEQPGELHESSQKLSPRLAGYFRAGLMEGRSLLSSNDKRV